MQPAILTIATVNYLPQAFLLLESIYSQHGSSLSYHIFLTEEVKTNYQDLCPEWIQILRLEDLKLDQIKTQAFQYQLHEFIFSLKPVCLQFLLDAGHKSVLYFDSDICVYHSLEHILKTLEEHDFVFTPHLTYPFLAEDKFPALEQLIQSGIFNLGFIGVSNSKQSKAALQWWQAVLKNKCLDQYGWGVFVDQSWASQLCCLVDRPAIIRNEGYNMAWWNLHQRSLTFNDQGYQTNDGPLVFFHFSHLSKTSIAEGQQWSEVKTGSCADKLLNEYRNQLSKKCQTLDIKNSKLPFQEYSDNSQITLADRVMFRNLTDTQKQQIGDPFLAKLTIGELLKNQHHQTDLKKTLKFLTDFPKKCFRAIKSLSPI